MRIIEKLVYELTDSEKKKLISQFEQFGRDGLIGTCELRSYALTLPFGANNVTIYMNFIGNECYRYFANKYFEAEQSEAEQYRSN